MHLLHADLRLLIADLLQNFHSENNIIKTHTVWFKQQQFNITRAFCQTYISTY